jgi:mannose-6-phosphate isomerase-like protein (cupin superfamily)
VTARDFIFEWTLAPGGSTGPAHRHPAHQEAFEVLEGRVRVRAGRRWRELGPGESAAVPPGVAHAVVNRGRWPALMRVTVTPGAGAEEFFERLRELDGAPAGWRRLAALASHFHDRRDFVRFGFPYAPGMAVLRRLQRPVR